MWWDGMKKIRVAAYCRVSKGGAEPEHSLQAQISFYTDIIRSEPHTPVSVRTTKSSRAAMKTSASIIRISS